MCRYDTPTERVVKDKRVDGSSGTGIRSEKSMQTPLITTLQTRRRQKLLISNNYAPRNPLACFEVNIIYYNIILICVKCVYTFRTD
jgi:hypothetical protein